MDGYDFWDYWYDVVSAEDRALMLQFIARTILEPDLTIAPDGNPYLFRWYLVPKNTLANVYLHLQVASDPLRPLHDHPWDNTSTILAGGYEEYISPPDRPQTAYSSPRIRMPGNVIHRPANMPHRLILPADIPYSISLFTTGPKVRDWGFWYPDGWRPFEAVTVLKDGVSIHRPEGLTNDDKDV